MTALTPAAELAARASKPCPNDSDDYRRARTALLAEEIELRRHIERVAAQRRALPLGGEALDCSFKAENGTTVKLADLFGRPGQDPRGAPDPTPLWNILDLTPGGRGVDWYPKLDYPQPA